tara:strand:+ start:6766 stop:7689 length:924 start_codon:yes stop_codon:yes gene_type:complete
MKKAVITGGAGFIGSNLGVRLISEGFEKIFIIDNLMRTNNLRNISSSPNVEFIYADACIFDFKSLGELSHFFHLASPKINRCAQFNFEGHKNLNESGYNAVNYCAHNHVKLFFASTASVYNNIKRLPIEEDDVCYPHTIYGAGKYYTECLIQSFNRMYNMDFTINRFFNVYGERMDSSGAYTEVIFNWLNAIKNGNPSITIYGNPDDKILDLVYVTDVIEAIITTMFNSNKQIFNVSTQKGVSLSQLIKTIEIVTKTKLQKTIIPDTRNDLELKRVGKTEKLESLGWRCKTDLHSGLSKTWEWIKDQ